MLTTTTNNNRASCKQAAKFAVRQCFFVHALKMKMWCRSREREPKIHRLQQYFQLDCLTANDRRLVPQLLEKAWDSSPGEGFGARGPLEFTNSISHNRGATANILTVIAVPRCPNIDRDIQDRVCVRARRLEAVGVLLVRAATQCVTLRAIATNLGYHPCARLNVQLRCDTQMCSLKVCRKVRAMSDLACVACAAQHRQ